MDDNRTNKKKSKAVCKSFCRIISCAGIILLVVIVCVIAVLSLITQDNNAQYEKQIAELEQKLNGLELQIKNQNFSEEQIAELEQKLNGLELQIKNQNFSEEQIAELEQKLNELALQIENQNSSEEQMTELEQKLNELELQIKNKIYFNEIKNNIPSYWQEEINSTIIDVNNTKDSIGTGLISFVWASDTHIPDGSTAYLGTLMAEVLDKCDISFATISGDIGTQASWPTEAEQYAQYEKISKHLYPLWGTKRLLASVGNHDGCWGDSAGYYRKQFSPKQMIETFFLDQQKDSRRIFSENGMYFYVDDDSQKVRYIMLNSQFGGEYLVNENGYAINNRFSTSCYGQEQLDWLSQKALNMLDGYAAIIVTHVPLLPEFASYTKDQSQIKGIITAYCNRTSFSGVIDDGIDGWTNSNINVDFSNAKGEIIAVFSGHCHKSTFEVESLPCPIITISNAGGDVRDGPTRTLGTSTETAFDVVMINRNTRTIYFTRVGAGSDRHIKY